MKKQNSWIGSFREASDEVNNWRERHPQATFNEIESRVDEKLARIRARMIEDLVIESQLTDFKEMPAAERPKWAATGE
ncbi:MAG: hypothetical protein KC418_02235 [Anaerolineales bacterium]|nr:hypothetical protein [Anaerolineales bacterium]MCB8954092.1 hypothetical protein [Ardenticatenales bacterium]